MKIYSANQGTGNGENDNCVCYLEVLAVCDLETE